MTTDLSKYDATQLPGADVLARQRYAVIVADWNSEITYAMAQGAVDAFLQHGVPEENIDIVHVPGTVELTYGAARLMKEERIDAVVVIGCVIQGETPFQVAQRLMSVAKMNYNAAVRYARTMTTNAQNSGRYNSYHRARDLGVELTVEWRATLDMHTRHDHRLMHGQRSEVDEPFITPDGFSILYPAQSEGPGSSDIPQKEIWNCRCTLRAWVKGFEGKTVKSSPGMEGMSFEEWQNANGTNQNRVNPDFTSQDDSPILNTSKFTATRINREGTVLNPMPEEEYDTIRSSLERNGVAVRAVLPTDDDDLFEYMMTRGIDGQYGNGHIDHLGEIPSRGTFFEEIIHMAQARRYGELVVGDYTEWYAREIEANRKLLRFRDAYRLDVADVEDIERNLIGWEADFRRITGVSYDDSNYRG